MRTLIFFLPLALFSMPIGNPAAPSLLQEGLLIPDTSWTNPQIGAESDFLLSKRFTGQGQLQGASQQGIAVWDLFERFNLEIDLGTGQFSWKRAGLQGQIDGGLLWNFGGKLIFLEMKDTTFALDGQIGGWDWMTGPASLNGAALAGKTTSKMRYWQAAAALSQKISLFSPYLGIAVNHSHFRVGRLPTGTERFRSLHRLGCFGGCTLTTGSRLSLNLEWRGWMEQAVTLSGQVRF